MFAEELKIIEEKLNFDELNEMAKISTNDSINSNYRKMC